MLPFFPLTLLWGRITWKHNLNLTFLTWFKANAECWVHRGKTHSSCFYGAVSLPLCTRACAEILGDPAVWVPCPESSPAQPPAESVQPGVSFQTHLGSICHRADCCAKNWWEVEILSPVILQFTFNSDWKRDHLFFCLNALLPQMRSWSLLIPIIPWCCLTVGISSNWGVR